MISTSSKYAIKALIYLARYAPDEYVQVRTLSEQAEVPGPFLAKIIKTLAARGVVETKKGLSGGVKLRNPRINFYDVCVAMDDPSVNSQCFLSKEPCNPKAPCKLHSKWNKTKNEMIAFLKEARIND